MHIAMPVMDEVQWLKPALDSLAAQSRGDFTLWACVNQPDRWNDDPGHASLIESNRRCLDILGSESRFKVRVLDRSSPGKGFSGPRSGVGMARHELFAAITGCAGNDDIAVCMDADTLFDTNYLEDVTLRHARCQGAVAMAAPYRHDLTGDIHIDRAICRYEIYLRTYLLNLLRIDSPYAFTAMGSVISVPVRTIRAIGSMPVRKAGEDFYFLQKAAKYGPVILSCRSRVHPAARLSDRVPVGTGPAIKKGIAGNWDSYPVFSHELFDKVRQTTSRFDMLWKGDTDVPLSGFIRHSLGIEDPWEPLRRNAPDMAHFTRACHERLDGLRIFQYLRSAQKDMNGNDEQRLVSFFNEFYPDAGLPETARHTSWSMQTCNINDLKMIRDTCMELEDTERKKHDESVFS